MTEGRVAIDTVSYRDQESLFSDLATAVQPERAPVTYPVPTIAIIGMGYVGLPTALAARAGGARTIGIDASKGRLRAIREQRVDLVPADRQLLARSVIEDGFVLTGSLQAMAEADAVLICVPTPIDEHRDPELSMVRAACADAVANARAGQLLILTSTSYPGTTRDLLAEPLAARGFTVGQDIFIASSPERIDPGNTTPHRDVPRVVGGVTPECTRRAADILRLLTEHVVAVSSPEAAEMTKLLENSFRAVNIAFANEMADVCASIGVDAREIIDAAATKPYGFMPFYPGTGVGGHCIPCDPHYLLWQLRARHESAPILTSAMDAIAARPFEIVDLIQKELSGAGRGIVDARVLVVGVAYKAGVEDVRESPALQIISELLDRDAKVDVYDPLVPSIRLDAQQILLSVAEPDPRAYDLVLVNTLHPGVDYSWIHDARIVVNPSGRTAPSVPRHAISAQHSPARAPGESVPERRVAERRAAFAIRG